MKWHSFHLLTLALVATALPCCAQTGTVTFYSIEADTARQFADALIPFGKAPFTGLLYDGSQQMAHAHGGRFVTFRLSVGDHEFSASYRSLVPGDPSLHLNVEDGSHSCVRLSANYKSGSVVMPLAVFHSVIQQVPCSEALQEAGKYRPLEMKRVDATVRMKLESSPTFPEDN
jgi:hypothetical protein